MHGFAGVCSGAGGWTLPRIPASSGAETRKAPPPVGARAFLGNRSGKSGVYAKNLHDHRADRKQNASPPVLLGPISLQQTTHNILSPDHTRGKRDSGEQAKLVLRWETRHWWDEICQRLGCNEAVARVVIALWCEHISAGRWTSYSRNRDHYGQYPSLFYTKHLVVSAAEWLDKAGLIFHWVQEENVRDWQSCMLPKPSLILIMQDIVRKLGRPVPAMPREQIILRNDRGESIGIRETRATRAMCRQVDEVNEMLLAADTTCSLAAVHRIFNGRMDRGGRWYAIGGAWQQMSEVARGNILIDGEKTVELDFKTQHAAMLFSDAGQTIPSDAYDIPGYGRELVKVGFLVLVNAKSEMEAVGAIAGKDEIDSMAEPDTKDAMKAARSLIKAIKSRHESILSAFHSDAGAGLMRRDSEIAGHVLTTMTKKGITVFPVHDSFIVRETAKEVLEEVMREATAIAGLPDIRIETKVPKAKVQRPRKARIQRVRNCKYDLTISMGSEAFLPTYPPCPVSLPSSLVSASVNPDSITNLDSSQTGAANRGSASPGMAPVQVVPTKPARSRLSSLRRVPAPALDDAGDLATVDRVSTPVRRKPSFCDWLNDMRPDAKRLKLSDVYLDATSVDAPGASETVEVDLQSSEAEINGKSALVAASVDDTVDAEVFQYDKVGHDTSEAFEAMWNSVPHRAKSKSQAKPFDHVVKPHKPVPNVVVRKPPKLPMPIVMTSAMTYRLPDLPERHPMKPGQKPRDDHRTYCSKKLLAELRRQGIDVVIPVGPSGMPRNLDGSMPMMEGLHDHIPF